MQAVAYIKGVLSVYDLGCRWMFTCGQQAYADYAQISNNNVERRRIQDAAVRYGRSCRRIRDKFEVPLQFWSHAMLSVTVLELLEVQSKRHHKVFKGVLMTHAAIKNKVESQAQAIMQCM